ncbi:hypothetical protein D3C71_1943570 [compost metagenome]
MEEEVLQHIMETETMLLTEITLPTEDIHQIETTLLTEEVIQQTEIIPQIDLTAIVITEEVQL